MFRRPLFLLLIVLAGNLASATAQAHGDAHADKPAAADVAPEQTAWGIAGKAKAARRTIALRMSDQMRFTPDVIKVRKGETVRLRVRNDGKLMHELVIGTKAVLDEHAKMMERFPNMEHDEPYMVHVAPGKTGDIVWQFNRAGTFDFACLIAGHYQAGMIGRIEVSER